MSQTPTTKSSGWVGHPYEAQYTSGKWGKGSMSAEQLAAKFGLECGEPAGDPNNYRSGHIWGKTESGEDVYIGKMNTGLSGNSELAAAHGAQMHPDEGSHSGGDGGMSEGDINGAILNLWDGSGGAKPVEEGPEMEPTMSTKANKALAYTEAYDDFNRSGGGVELMSGNLGARDQFMNNYKLNLQKRMEPGTARTTGADDLWPTQPDPTPINKTSKIAKDIVGKGAGFGPIDDK